MDSDRLDSQRLDPDAQDSPLLKQTSLEPINLAWQLRLGSTALSQHTASPSPKRLLTFSIEEDETPAEDQDAQRSGKRPRLAEESSTANKPTLQDSHVGTSPSQKPPFSLWTAFCEHPDILLTLATQHMTPQQLISLYAISKRFHYLVNSHYTTYVNAAVRRWAQLFPSPGNPIDNDTRAALAAIDNHITAIFPPSNYRHLCIRDPARRPAGSPSTPSTNLLPFPPQPTQTHPHPALNSRLIPSLRYLLFLHHRTTTISRITTTLLYAHGLRLHPQTPTTLAKLWRLLDLPTTAARITHTHNPALLSDADLRRAAAFSLRLDMATNDPFARKPHTTLRRLLWRHPSLTKMADVLDRSACTSYLDAARLYIRTSYIPAPETAHCSVLGVPAADVGTLSREGGTSTSALPVADRPRLLAPDELVLREAVRRGVVLKPWDMLTEGFFDKETLEPLPPILRPEWWDEQYVGYVGPRMVEGVYPEEAEGPDLKMRGPARWIARPKDDD